MADLTKQGLIARTAGADLIDSLIAPRSIAVLGASGRRVASGNHALRNLIEADYSGELHAVHRSSGQIEGIETVRDIAGLPSDLDVAMVSVAAPSVLEALLELEQVGCKAAVVPAVGITPEDREGIAAFRDRGTMAICGPNTMGLINVADRIPMVFWPGVLTSVRPGGVALVSQSGGASIAIVRSTERAGYSRIIPSGNEWTTDSADYLEWLAEDLSTESVGLVVESIVAVDRFSAAVKMLRDRGKRIVVLHVGRSQSGARTTQAHTGAMIGRPEAFKAYFEDLDVPLVSDYDEMASVLDAFSIADLPRAGGDRVAVITVSGGLAALAADIAEEEDMNLADLGDSTRRQLDHLLPGAEIQNPFDTGGGVSYTPEAFSGAVKALAGDPNVDSVMAVIDAQATLTEQEFEYEKEDFDAVVKAVADIPKKPVVLASTSAATIHPRWHDEIGLKPIPLVRGLSSAFVVLRSLGMNRKPILPVAASAGAASPAAREWFAAGKGNLPPQQSREMLLSYGIPVVKSTVVTDPEAAHRAALEIGFPLVVKVSSAQIPHRSEVGGVVTGIADEAELLSALDLIEQSVKEGCPGARIDGFELQEFVPTRLEALVGSVSDPVFGPLVAVGLGGVLVELLDDRASARAPIESAKARELVDSTRLATVASGYRGLVASTDLRPLADLVSAFSRLVFDFRGVVAEADLNPVLIEEGSGRVLVADSLIVGQVS